MLLLKTAGILNIVFAITAFWFLTRKIKGFRIDKNPLSDCSYDPKLAIRFQNIIIISGLIEFLFIGFFIFKLNPNQISLPLVFLAISGASAVLMALFSCKRSPFLHGLFGLSLYFFTFACAIAMSFEIAKLNLTSAIILTVTALVLLLYLLTINITVKVIYAKQEFIFLFWLLLFNLLVAVVI